MARKGKVLAEWRKEERPEDDDQVDIRVTHFAVRTDGVVLEKRSVHFRANRSPNIEAYWHSWGWKVRLRYNKGYLPQQIITSINRQLLSKGFEKVN